MTTLAQSSHHPRDAFRGVRIKGPAGIVTFIPSDTPAIEDDELDPATDWGDWQTPDSINDAIDQHNWTDDELRHAHAAHVAGRREPWTIAGHREWDRRYRAAKRASMRMSAEDLRWAERAAETHFWQAFETANRRAGADEPTMQKARNLSMRFSTGPVRQPSTPPVDNGLSQIGEHLFDERTKTERTA